MKAKKLIFERIAHDIKSHDIVLYMKGTKEVPLCGFSGLVIKILNTFNIPFLVCNILEDPELRQGIKDFTNWPTIPQLYVDGEFVGGADIVKEMYDSGELQELLKLKIESDTGPLIKE